MRNNIRDIELRRLEELERQAALHGPRTEPSVLLEIQDLHHKYPETRQNDRGFYMASLDYDFLMNVVASALMRVTELEKDKIADKKDRLKRQVVQDVWKILITIICFLTLLMVLVYR